MKSSSPFFLCILLISLSISSRSQSFSVQSPDGDLVILVEVADRVTWSLMHADQQILTPSPIAMELESGETLGESPKVQSSKARSVETQFQAINYVKSIVRDHYNELILKFKQGYSLEFRAYNEAGTYRFVTRRKDELLIANEHVGFQFTGDHMSFVPYMWDYRGGKKYNVSFESLYTEKPLSEQFEDSVIFLPLLVDVGNGKKAVILEADVEDYPNLLMETSDLGFRGHFARFPLDVQQGGFGRMNLIPTRRADYIARVQGQRSFPWRVVVISESDKELLDIDIVQKLASPNRLDDITWIQPGQVAWDWWNNWNISGVDFEAGINTPTYFHYIDFAAENGIAYIIMDDGWSSRLDLFDLNPNVDLKAIIDYGIEKNVGVVLWASWYAILNQKDQAFPHYRKMGVKGFKIDFIDRDDQVAVASTYEIAAQAASHQLLVDYHGVFKPAGLQRTYPNVVGYEGVKGLENVKWAQEDAPRYALSIPFIRMMSGVMDYTPGAMRNATQSQYHPVSENPMSQGTRCHQLAMYIIHEVPFQMLCDNPTTYREEQPSTDFITRVPTTFDETVTLDGKVGEFAALARRKGDTWFIGAMTNWTPRKLKLDLSFLAEGVTYQATIFQDGKNAHRNATDHRRIQKELTRASDLTLSMSNGGGWVASLSPKD